MKLREQPIVLYHGSCNDGFCAAWVFQLAKPAADYRPYNYGQKLPRDCEGRNVVLLDIAATPAMLNELCGMAQQVLLLDHHKTAIEDLAGYRNRNFKSVLDGTKSGGRLAWEYLFQTQSHWLVDYTEDRDLWRWALPDSRAINAGLSSFPHEFKTWNCLANVPWRFDQIEDVVPWSRLIDWQHAVNVSHANKWAGDIELDMLISDGNAILRYQDQLTNRLCDAARECIFDGFQVRIVNTGTQISEVAGRLAEDNPFGVAWFQRRDGKYAFSLRSRGEDGLDVSEIAKRHGGGGHVAAAGFETDKWPDFISFLG